ncbi:Aspartic peptidase domain [Phytophthora cactorum]|nr:Aspartic peptidase domain [Phytophthora cactorum]
MSAIIRDDTSNPGCVDPDRVQPDPLDPDRIVLQLGLGQRYGWREDHDQDGKHDVVMVHGAVNDNRARILLDTGASGSMMSLDIARRLKLSFRMLKDVWLPTCITAEARVKVTLEWLWCMS